MFSSFHKILPNRSRESVNSFQCEILFIQTPSKLSGFFEKERNKGLQSDILQLQLQQNWP